MTQPYNLYYDVYEDIIKWNKIGGAGNHNFSLSAYELQLDLIQEELAETLAALKQDDKVEFIDGLADLFVVTTYACYLEDRVYAEPEKVVSEAYYFKPDFSLYEIPKKEDFSFCLSCIDTAVKQKQPKVVLTMWYALVDCLGLNMDKPLKEVMRSNWTKYPKLNDLTRVDEDGYGISSLDAATMQCDFIYANTRYSGVVYEIVDEEYVVFRDENGKIMKWSGFSKPDLEFVNNWELN